MREFNNMVSVEKSAGSRLGITKNSLELFCVPRVYLGSAFSQFFSLLPFRGINNLRVFNGLSSSIPTAPTIHLHDGWTLNKNTRGQKGAD